MGTNNYTGITILLMAVTLSSESTEQLPSVQRGYGLIKFEGDQQSEQGQRQHGIISFQEQEFSQANYQPFRFDEPQSFREDPLKDHRNPQSYIGLDDSVRFGQVDGLNHPQNFREDPLKDHRNPQSYIGLDNSISFGQGDGLNQPEESINSIKPGVTFQDDNRIEEQKGQKKRKKRRRRRPRLQQFPASGVHSGYPSPWTGYLTSGSGYPTPGAGYPAPVSAYPVTGSGYPVPGFGYPNSESGYPTQGSGYPTQGSGYPTPYGENPSGNPAFGPGLYRPLRRPRPQSVASDALTAVTEALTSIARYDDYQCVPRLLCEAAGGGALGVGAPGTGAGSGLLQSVTALQPLLTLLSAYNGISTSPLFIFGRAVFLGMTSRGAPVSPGAPSSPGAPATCRYAYPLCPTDPEQLVHYLNNHNGGFFRFFNAPQRPNPQYGLQQNLEQFYNQLAASQNPGQYGLYQPTDLGSPGQHGQLGYPVPGAAQGYGLYNGVQNQQYDSNYQVPASNGYQNYGANYPYNQQNYGFAKFESKKNKRELKDVNRNKIEDRIQNVKSDDDFDDDNFSSNAVDRYKNSKWLFPSTNRNKDYPHRNIQTKRENKQLTFPEENVKSDNSNLNRKAKGFYFPEAQSNRDLGIYAYEDTSQNNNAFFDDYRHDVQIETPKDGSEEGVEVVYIVRGDGDPKNPEVVKLRPGQTLQSIGLI